MNSQSDSSCLVTKDGTCHRLELKKIFTIGRGLSNTLTLEDLNVSRSHCRIKEINGVWCIVDESGNGTFVNGQRICKHSPHFLSNGDKITLGENTEFQFFDAKSNVELEKDICQVAAQAESKIERRYNTRSAAKTTGENSNEVQFIGEEIAKNKKPADNAENKVVMEASAVNKKVEEVIAGGEASGINASGVIRHTEMENEMQCSICTELFIKAQTLNCSHSYCRFCITEWKKKNKICPICRAPIKNITPTIILDNLIEKLFETSSEEAKTRRKATIEEREKLEKPKQKKMIKPRKAKSRFRRGRASSSTIVISDDDEDVFFGLAFSDDDFDEDGFDYNDDDDMYIPGDDDVYYGGYGSCFRCGARGHWANGCPIR